MSEEITRLTSNVALEYHVSYFKQQMTYVCIEGAYCDSDPAAYLTADQALQLLKWLEGQKATLERIAQEEGTEGKEKES